MNLDAAAIWFRSIHHTFDPDIPASVLADVTIRVPQGELVAVVGPSGCGKTTLLNMAAGLIRPSSGEVFIHGVAPSLGDPRVGYMLARDCLLPWRNALGNATLALDMRGGSRRLRREKALAMLDRLGLAGSERLYPAQLSQGMRQRVALARCFVAEPQVLLLDEPFSALDAETKLDVHDAFLEQFEGSGAAAMMVTHDVPEAIALADTVVVLTRRPGRMRSTVHVDIPRPRAVADLPLDPRYHRVLESVWREVRGDVLAPLRARR
jgi:NitT/TauT family transport system ATP-binding protein